MVSTYEAGDLVRCTVVFTDTTGVVTDPTTVDFYLAQPKGGAISHQTYNPGTIVKDGVGTYHCDVTPTTDGIYAYHWQSTGPSQRSITGTFSVLKTVFSG